MGKLFEKKPSEGKREILDFKSLRTRWLWGVGALVTGLAAVALYVLDWRESTAHERLSGAQVEAVARSVSVWMDGDAHAQLSLRHAPGSLTSWDGAPAELVVLCDGLRRTSTANGLTFPIRTLRLNDELRDAVAAEPDRRHPLALEVVATGEDDLAWRRAVDYLPEMGPAFFEGATVAAVTAAGSAGELAGYAPVLDSWDSVAAIVAVQTPASRPVLGFLLQATMALAVTVALLFLALKLFDVFVRRHQATLAQLATDAERLAAGHLDQPVESPTTSREILRLAEALEAWRAGVTAAVGTGEPARSNPPVRRKGRPRGRIGGTAPGVATFDVRLLIDQAIQPFRNNAAAKGVALSVVVGDKVPPQLECDPGALLTSLTALISNAVRHTNHGSVAIRVNRVMDTNQLRFEVADTGVGVAWQAQPRLDQILTEAAATEPSEVEGGLRCTAGLATKLGGQIGFESQPGAGSRFWFTACYSAPHNTQLEAPAAALPVRRQVANSVASVLRKRR